MLSSQSSGTFLTTAVTAKRENEGRENCDQKNNSSNTNKQKQVSGAAAKSIKRKFIALFPNPTASPTFFPPPATVAAADLALLRTAGLSGRKAEYVSGLAGKFASGELSAGMLVRASDAEVLERLVAVRGLGRWSVEMFACFGLKRMDVFSTGDLGVQRGMAAWLGRDVGKLKAKGGGKWKYLSEGEMLEQAERFAPYRFVYGGFFLCPFFFLSRWGGFLCLSPSVSAFLTILLRLGCALCLVLRHRSHARRSWCLVWRGRQTSKARQAKISFSNHTRARLTRQTHTGVCSCGTCGGSRTSTSTPCRAPKPDSFLPQIL